MFESQYTIFRVGCADKCQKKWNTGNDETDGDSDSDGSSDAEEDD